MKEAYLLALPDLSLENVETKTYTSEVRREMEAKIQELERRNEILESEVSEIDSIKERLNALERPSWDEFVEREYRRGNKYDAIIMDPPSYGRGPNKEVWKFEDNIYSLINACIKILSDEPLFFLINSYTTGISSTVLENILKSTLLPLYPNGTVDAGEVGLPISNNNLVLPCGIYGRYISND